VFAPTNDAFDAISSVTAGLNIEQLRRVLEYHVISGVAAKSTDLTNLEVLLPLVSGKSLHVNLDNPGEVRIVGETNYVTVTIADVLCTNGVVHIVDAVLIPILSASIVESVKQAPYLSSLVGALESADLVGALSGPGPFTVFAPTNDAFDAISSVTAGLNIEQLRRVLEYHVISGVAAKSTDLTNLEVLLPLVSGKSLHVNLDNPGEVRIVGETNYVTVTIADVLCTNGVVHIVDAVLIPILSEKSLVMASPADPCCNECSGSDRKYYSVDMKRGHCGEACIYPGQFALFKVFESNLTRADGSTGYKSCADLGWPKYQETVTHGDPLKLLTVTLDLYGHDEVSAVI